MSAHPRHLALLAALAVVSFAGRARAQDDGSGAEPDPAPAVPAPAVPGPASGQGTALPLPAAGPVESTEEWVAFSRAAADDCFRQGRVPAALEEYFACAALRPHDLDVVADAAMVAVEYASSVAHGLEESSAHLHATRRLIQLGLARGGHEDGRLAYVIGRLEASRGRYGAAAQRFEQSLATMQVDMDRLRPWLFMAAVHRSPVLLAQGRAEDVIRALETLTAELPEHPDIVLARALLSAAYGEVGEKEKSEELLAALTRDYPDDHRTWSAVGRARAREARYEEALDAYRQALSLATSDSEAYAGALLAIGTTLHHLDRLDEAEEAVRGFLANKKDAPIGLRLLAEILHDKGQSLDAVRLLRRADRISGGAPPVLDLLESILRERGETAEADEVRARLDALRAAAARRGDAGAPGAGEGADEPEGPEPPR